jgi:hypothetical protein
MLNSFLIEQGGQKNEFFREAISLRLLTHLDYPAGCSFSCFPYIHAKAPQWWYVKSSQTSMLLTLFVVIADVFMLPILFLLLAMSWPLAD